MTCAASGLRPRWLRLPLTSCPPRCLLQTKLADVPVTMVEVPAGGGGQVGSPPAPRVLVRKRPDRMPRGGMMPGMEGPYGMAGANGQFRWARQRRVCTAALVMLAEVQWGFGERGPGGEGGGPLLRAVVQASTGLQPVLVGSKAA